MCEKTLEKRKSERSWLKRLALVTLLMSAVLLLYSCAPAHDANPEDTPSASTPSSEADPVTVAPAETSADSAPADTASPTTEALPETEPATEAPAPGPTLWTPDMGPFNQGCVVYEKTVTSDVWDEFPTDKIGQSMMAGQTGVLPIFSTEYDVDDITCNGQTAIRSGGSAKVLDGVFYMPYNADSVDRLASDGWTTYSLVPGASVHTYKQVQLSLDWTIFSRGAGAWMNPVWGCYVSNYMSKIPDGPGDGLWIAFNNVAHAITIHHPDEGSWPAGWAVIPVDATLMKGMIHTNIVCTSDYTTYIYLTAEGSQEEVLAGKITFADGKIRVFGVDGALIKEGNCSTDSLKGDNFVLFTHAGGGVYIDRMAILAASKGETVTHTTVTATPTEGHTLGLDITNKTDLVSICYSVWFDAILGGGSEKIETYHNITEALAGRQPWGGVPSFHYWAKPAQGYYRSSDKNAIRQNMTWLYEAGVDFIIIDLTNAGDGYIGDAAWTSYIETPMNAMLDTIMEMRAEGKGTPYVVFWSGTSQGPLYQALYDKYHAVEKWKDCFVYWDGKPLLLTTHTDPADFPLSDLYTVRMMWGLNNDHHMYHWNFLNINNYKSVSPDANGQPEQISVAVAAQETYMSRTHSAHGRNHGIFWYAQWAYAFEVHPKIVTLTWWNEWCAQRLDINGEIVFTDNYTQEYSRDIEPMEGGHGDQYYQWLKQYIAHYKGGAACPVLVEEGCEAKAEKYYSRQKAGR